MNEEQMQQVTESTQRLAAAAEALEQAIAQITAQQAAMNLKIDRIVAAIDEGVFEPALSANEAEKTGHPMREYPTLATEARMGHPAGARHKGKHVHAGRKTLSPLVTMILAKSGIEETGDTAVLDKALGALSPEQRIAVKTEMARAGMIA